MQPVWLVEADFFGEMEQPLIAEVRRQGHRLEVVQYGPFVKDVAGFLAQREIARDACVVVRASYALSQFTLKYLSWRPGAWCDMESCECATYYAYLGQRLLNQRYVMMPYAEAVRHREWLFRMLALDGQVFVRPSGCHKIFTGQLVDGGTFESAMSATRYAPHTLVVVAQPCVLHREWRLVMAEGRMVAASQYLVEGEKVVAPGCPGEVTAFAEESLRSTRWRCDPMFIMDVAETDDGLAIIEINPFSTSGLYACALTEVVEVASRIAVESGRG